MTNVFPQCLQDNCFRFLSASALSMVDVIVSIREPSGINLNKTHLKCPQQTDGLFNATFSREKVKHYASDVENYVSKGKPVGSISIFRDVLN